MERNYAIKNDAGEIQREEKDKRKKKKKKKKWYSSLRKRCVFMLKSEVMSLGGSGVGASTECGRERRGF